MKKEYRNVVRTKKAIRETFIELLDEKNKTENISVSELCARADIAKSTFYNHYPDVYAVAEEFESELIQALSSALDEIQSNPTIGLEESIFKITAFLKKNADLYRKTVQSPNIRASIEKLKTVVAQKMFERSQVLPLSMAKTERYIQIRMLTNACVDTVVDYFTGALDAPLDDITQTILGVLNRIKQK